MLFEKGQYLPLFATGSAREHVVAFARRYRAQWAIIAAPRLVAKLTRGSDLMPRHWAREVIQLPPGAPGRWRDSFSKAQIEATQLDDGMGIRLASLFEAFPVALLERGD